MSIDIKNLKPEKVLGKGSEGIVILTNNNKYTIKIYKLDAKRMINLLRVVDYLKKYNLPTIYKSYDFLSKKNSLNRYINEMPKYFAYLNEENLKKLSKNYNMKNRLIEIMKTYIMTLQQFIDNEIQNNPKKKYKIIESFYHQAIITLLWMYMKKGIIHGDISLDNFFVQKTDAKIFSVEINKNIYETKLYGYYLVFSDFGRSNSFELFDNDEFPDKINSIFGSGKMNPYYEILEIINIFKKYIKINLSNNKILIDGMFNSSFNVSLRQSYKNLIKSYMKNENFKANLKNFKKEYYNYVSTKIL